MPGAGRPKKDPHEPPMPQAWKPTERLAACLAYLEVSEQGPTPDIDTKCHAPFATQLQYVNDSVSDGEFQTSTHKWAGRFYHYTLEEAKTRRPVKTSVSAMFTQTRKECNKTILPAYTSLLTQDGKVPSGTEKDELIKQLKKKLAEEAAGEDIEVDGEQGAMPPGAVPAEGIGTARAPPTRPTQEHPCFLTWMYLGPLGKQHRQFMEPMPAGSGKESEIPKPEGREAKRARQREENFKAGGSSLDAQKLKELQKISRGAKEHRKIARSLTQVEKKKEAREAYDLELKRYELRLKLVKGPEKKELEAAYLKLLEAGPAEVSAAEESADSAAPSPAKDQGSSSGMNKEDHAGEGDREGDQHQEEEGEGGL